MAGVPGTQESMQQCICGGCPSYNICMQENRESLCCARVKIACELERNGCTCGACPLAIEYDLDKLFYCATGAEE